MTEADTQSARGGRNTLQIFHININCTSLERSVGFYELLGFKMILDFQKPPGGKVQSFAEIGLGPVLRLPPDLDGRACLMAVSDDLHTTRLDLIEWNSPRERAEPRRNLAQPGVARICLKVRDCHDLHDRLVKAGYAPYSAPEKIAMGGSQFLVFCCEDPDGVVMEFMEFARAAS
jgi:glyoxylase I family protein